MDRPDLKTLREVSKRLNHVSTPYFYESITISTAELSRAGLISAVKNIPSVLQYIKHIWIKAPFHETSRYCYLHRVDSRLSDEAMLQRVDGLTPEIEAEVSNNSSVHG